MSQLDTTRGFLPNWLSALICLLLVLPNALLVYVTLGIGISYNQDQTLAYAALFTVLSIVLGTTVWLAARRWRRRWLAGWPRSLGLLLGLSLTGFGLFALAFDSGDWFLWIWPAFLGISLFWISRKGDE